MRHELINSVLNLVKTTPLESKQFLNHISSYIRPLKYAKHFQHELLAFAVSKFVTIEEYDSRCVYYKGHKEIPKKTETVDFLPLKSLPVILTKYKHTSFPADALGYVAARFWTPAEGEEERTRVNNEPEVLSDQSSFCEELTPPRKKTPEIIDLISSSGSESVRSASDLSESETRRKLESMVVKRRRAESASSSSGESSGRTSKRHRDRRHEKKSKKKKKKKKSKKRHRSSRRE